MKGEKQNLTQELTKITKHPQGVDLFKMLLNQIEKDLNMCGLDWGNKTETNPEQLVPELESVITNLLKGGYKNDIRMFLYRVDVSEKLLRQIDILTVEEIVNLVLHREIEKIWMKHKYSTI